MTIQVELEPWEKQLGMEPMEVPDGNVIQFSIGVRVDSPDVSVEQVQEEFDRAFEELADTTKRHRVAERWLEKLRSAS